jgi:tetratricopeptide (TPR) repeat protein
VFDRALVFGALGNAHRVNGNFLAAQHAFERGISVLNQLHQQNPAVPLYAFELAAMQMDVGFFQFRRGKLEEAAAGYRMARDLFAELARAHPTIPNYVVQQARAATSLGMVLYGQKKFAEACRQHALAAQLVHTPYQRMPNQPEIKEALAQAHHGRADTLRELKDYAAALKDVDRALELTAGPWHQRLRGTRASILALCGRVDEATKEAEALTAKTSAPPEMLYEAACTYALAARWIRQAARGTSPGRQQQAEGFEGKAVQLLLRAKDAGLFKDPAVVEHLKQDGDLEALHARPDYKKLVTELEKKPPMK